MVVFLTETQDKDLEFKLHRAYKVINVNETVPLRKKLFKHPMTSHQLIIVSKDYKTERYRCKLSPRGCVEGRENLHRQLI